MYPPILSVISGWLWYYHHIPYSQHHHDHPNHHNHHPHHVSVIIIKTATLSVVKDGSQYCHVVTSPLCILLLHQGTPPSYEREENNNLGDNHCIRGYLI